MHKECYRGLTLGPTSFNQSKFYINAVATDVSPSLFITVYFSIFSIVRTILFNVSRAVGVKICKHKHFFPKTAAASLSFSPIPISANFRDYSRTWAQGYRRYAHNCSLQALIGDRLCKLLCVKNAAVRAIVQKKNSMIGTCHEEKGQKITQRK